MRTFSKITLLAVSLLLTACADPGAAPIIDDPGPQAPVNDPDTGVFNPPGGGNSTSGGGNNSGGTGSSGTGSGGGNSGGGGSGGGGGGGGNSGGGGGGNSGGGGGGNSGGGGGGGSGGGNGSQPVPEPGTLILFGSGLAGVGASLLRRRRRAEASNS